MNKSIPLKYYNNQQGGSNLLNFSNQMSSYGITGNGFGIINVGNTCWLNAYTQLIIHSKKYIDKLKKIKDLNPKINKQQNLLNKIINFMISLHDQVINRTNTINTKDINLMKDYASKLSKFIRNCKIGQFHDSDEKLSEFQNKIIEVLDLDFEKNPGGKITYSKEFYIKDKQKIDDIVKKGKDEMKKLININNPFETSLHIVKNIYDKQCQTLDNENNAIDIHGNIMLIFLQGWLNVFGISYTNSTEKIDFSIEIKNQLYPKSENIELDCTGNTGNSKVKSKRIEYYDLEIDDNMPSLLYLKIIRPKHFLIHSINYSFNEFIEISDSEGKINYYVLIGGIVNVRLANYHYTSFVRRNNKYYYHNDDASPVLINDINNSNEDLGRTTTFVIYEKIDILNLHLKEMIYKCNQ